MGEGVCRDLVRMVGWIPNDTALGPWILKQETLVVLAAKDMSITSAYQLESSPEACELCTN